MDGPSTVAAITGFTGAATAIATAFINRGAKEGVAELRKQIEHFIGADGKAGPDTEIGKLKSRVGAIEAMIGTAAAMAAIPGEVAALRAHIEQQLRAARDEWDSWKRSQRRATGSQPALVDEEARREASEAIRRVEQMERERRDDRESMVELQLQIERMSTKLDLLLGGNINLGGKSR